MRELVGMVFLAVAVLAFAWLLVKQPTPKRSRGPSARFVREPQQRMTLVDPVNADWKKPTTPNEAA